MALTQDQQNFILEGGTLNTSDESLQKEQADFVKANSANAPITSNDLVPTTQTEFDTADTPIPPRVPADSPEPSGFSGEQPTEAGTEFDTLSRQTSALEKEIAVGSAELKKEKTKELGLGAERGIEQELLGQLAAFRDKQDQIPLQVQQQFAGRASVGQIQRKSEAALRQNAIEALGISAQLNIARGNIASAKLQIEEAIEAEFGVKIAELEANISNLERLSESPELSRQERNAINEATAQMNFNLQQAEDEKEEKQNTKDSIVEIAKFNPNASGEVLAELFNAESELDAIAIAINNGLSLQEAEEDKLLTVTEAAKLGVPFGTTQSGAFGLTPTDTGTGGALSLSNNTGEAFLQELNPNRAELIRSIADYKADPAKIASIRKGDRERLIQEVIQFDPSYDMTQFPARAALRKDFTSGKGAVNIRSLNTAIGHLESLQKSANKLDNASFTLWNKAKNPIKTVFGSPDVTTFKNDVNAVAGEMATVFKGTSGTDQEITKWEEGFNANMSPAQITDAIEEMVDLMNSRLFALSSQWEAGMGKPKDFRFLNDKSEKIISEMDIEGVDDLLSQDAIEPQVETGGVATPEQAGNVQGGGQEEPLSVVGQTGLTISMSNGKTYTFPDEETLQKFVNEQLTQ